MRINNLFIGNFAKIGQSWWFWIILVVIIVFIVYSGLKKNRAEKKQRKQREKEVKKLIKRHLAQQPRFQNITISYKDVIARTGKQYNSRDVFDVFIEIINKKKGGSPILKCYEIEGFAEYLNPKDKKSDVIVDWRINHEFSYEKHHVLLRKRIPSRLSIYFFSLFEGRNRKAYLTKHLTEREKIIKQRQTLNQKSVPKKQKEEIFRPEIKNESDDENL